MKRNPVSGLAELGGVSTPLLAATRLGVAVMEGLRASSVGKIKVIRLAVAEPPASILRTHTADDSDGLAALLHLAAWWIGELPATVLARTFRGCGETAIHEAIATYALGTRVSCEYSTLDDTQAGGFRDVTVVGSLGLLDRQWGREGMAIDGLAEGVTPAALTHAVRLSSASACVVKIGIGAEP